MKLVVPTTEQLPLIARYVEGKAPGNPGEFADGMYTAHAILNDAGEFVGGVIYSLYRGYDIHISGAAETGLAARPHAIRAVFDYVFKQLGCKRCTMLIAKRNSRARQFAEKLGFTLEGNLRLGYDGQRDGLIYGILASECRYIDGGISNGFNAESADPARSVGDVAGSKPDEQGYGGRASEHEPYRSVHPAGELDVLAGGYER